MRRNSDLYDFLKLKGVEFCYIDGGDKIFPIGSPVSYDLLEEYYAFKVNRNDERKDN